MCEGRTAWDLCSRDFLSLTWQQAQCLRDRCHLSLQWGFTCTWKNDYIFSHSFSGCNFSNTPLCFITSTSNVKSAGVMPGEFRFKNFHKVSPENRNNILISLLQNNYYLRFPIDYKYILNKWIKEKKIIFVYHKKLLSKSYFFFAVCTFFVCVSDDCCEHTPFNFLEHVHFTELDVCTVGTHLNPWPTFIWPFVADVLLEFNRTCIRRLTKMKYISVVKMTIALLGLVLASSQTIVNGKYI